MGFTREFFRFFPQFSPRVELMGFATIDISGTAKGLNLKFAHKMYIRTNIQKMQKKIEKFAVNRFYQITADLVRLPRVKIINKLVLVGLIYYLVLAIFACSYAYVECGCSI